MLGWASQDYLLFSLIIAGPIAGILGSGCLIFMLDYFHPHVVASIYLTEPLIGQALGCLLKQDKFPGILSFIGVIGMTFGIYLSIRGDQLRTKSQISHEKLNQDIELSSSIL